MRLHFLPIVEEVRIYEESNIPVQVSYDRREQFIGSFLLRRVSNEQHFISMLQADRALSVRDILGFRAKLQAHGVDSLIADRHGKIFKYF